VKVWEPGIRDQAAIGIVRLLSKRTWADSDTPPRLRRVLRELSTDRNPVVRMQAAHGLQLTMVDEHPPTAIIGHLRAPILEEDDENVLAVHLQTLQSVMASAPASEVDQLMEELAARPQGAFLSQDSPDQGPADANRWDQRNEVVELASAILTRLGVTDRTPFSAHRLSGWLTQPLSNTARTQTLVRQFQPYLNPPDSTGQETTFTLLGTAARALQAAWREANSALPAGGDETSGRARDTALIAHQIAQQLEHVSGPHDDRSSVGSPVALRAEAVFADHALSLLRELSSVQHPQVTQPVVKALIHFGNTHPAEVLEAIANAVPETGLYVADPLAAGTVCPYLLRVLAENRDIVLGTEPGLTAFLHLLQAFAGAGHSDALSPFHPGCSGFVTV
jgi:hypothetical protein